MTADHDNMQVAVPATEDAQGGTLIYIDNSNIWINTMEDSAKRLQFINDIKQDHRIRVNINKLLSTASAGRPILRAVLYGSEPPPVEKFWNNVKDSSFCKVDVQVTNRSPYSNKEKDVDQNIMLDIGEDIVIHQNHAKYGGTLILFTGDGGMIAAVRRAIKYNWNVEVWSYKSSLAKDYVEEAEGNEKLTLKYLDDHFAELIFYTLQWKTFLPDERSLVMTFHRIPCEKKSETLEAIIKCITQLVRMPMAGRYIKEKDEKATNSTHLALVCSVGQQILKEDSRYINKLDNDFHHYSHNNEHNRKQGFNLNLNSEQFKKIAKLFEWPNDQINEEMKHNLKSIICGFVSLSNSDNDPKYDFNKDVYSKIEDYLNLDHSLIETEIGNNENERNILSDVIRNYKPSIRSVPQFLQDMKVNHLSELEYYKLESPAMEYDDDGGFTVHTNRRQGKKFQKYSKSCKYSFRCHNGFKCPYKHTDKEKEFFKIQPNPKLRYCYKAIPCEHYAKKIEKNNKIHHCCKYHGRLSYMCPFAHGYFCLFCRCDEDAGHTEKNCLAPAAMTNITP